VKVEYINNPEPAVNRLTTPTIVNLKNHKGNLIGNLAMVMLTVGMKFKALL
tara:strand:+ start:1134 stop:1286 length:153 start_codon:yes stop_codon:yes gene_type:complete